MYGKIWRKILVFYFLKLRNVIKYTRNHKYSTHYTLFSTISICIENALHNVKRVSHIKTQIDLHACAGAKQRDFDDDVMIEKHLENAINHHLIRQLKLLSSIIWSNTLAYSIPTHLK